MQTPAKVEIIGVGCSILFHLAKLGWKDVVLLARRKLSWGFAFTARG